MRTAWRIVKTRHSRRAFDGEGARRYGGRWNSPGTAVVYVASSRPLAALEMLVHLDRAALLPSYVAIRCEFDDRLVVTVPRETLPSNWRRDPPPPDLARIGDAWIRAGESAALAVPSSIIAEEMNYLLNPAHRDFRRIAIGRPEAFEFDDRLVK